MAVAVDHVVVVVVVVVGMVVDHGVVVAEWVKLGKV